MRIDTGKLVAYLDRRLDIGKIPDDSCNGLQVSGAARVESLALAVDASLESYARAVSARCQFLLVHHGLIWGGLKSVRGLNRAHLKYLLDHDLNLYAAHLPLDRHASVGHNSCLAAALGLKSLKPFGDYHGLTIGFAGRLPAPLGRAELARRLAGITGGEAFTLPTGPETVRTLGIVSGGGGRALHEAVDKNLDCFVTGEKSYAHLVPAREAGINVIYLGHYHSETPGLKALGEELAARFGLKTVFLDLPPA